ncbi:MAG: pilus assembly protein PilM [Patescibacteria group bacterium]|nr:pilus assembly protein PilM [Patescibacteria group bacterium]MDD4610994.1 pilus assembly protein PilM [Patescibacteria group bacterium]
MNIFNKKSIGLDIADHTVEAAELLKEGNGYKIISKNRLAIEPGVVESGRIKNEKRLGEIIAKLFKEAKPSAITDKKIIFGLPESQIYTYVLRLGAHKEKDREALVLVEAKKIVPLEEENLIFYFQVIKILESGETEILLVAANRESILEWYDFFRKQNIKVGIIDIEPLAIYRSLFEKNTQKPTAILDLGAANSKVYLFDKDGLRHSYVINIAGDKITKDLAEKFKISFAEAEEQKIANGLNGERKEIADVIKKHLEAILAELKESFDFFIKKTNQNIAEVILVGGTGKMIGIVDYFKDSLNLPVKLGESPLIKSDLPFEYLESAGLALRGLGRVITKDEKSFDLDQVEEDSKLLGKLAEVKKSDAKILKKEEKNYGAIQSDEEPEGGDEDKYSSQSQQLEKIKKDNQQIEKKLRNQKIALVIILAVGLIAVGLAFLYRVYGTKKETKNNSADFGQYSQIQTVDIKVPVAVEPKQYTAERVSGRIIENFIQTLGDYDSMINNSEAAVENVLNQGEAIIPEPINKSTILSATTTPITVRWIVYREAEADSLFLNELEKNNKNKEKYILSGIIKKRAEPTENSGIYYLDASATVFGNKLIDFGK